MTVGAVIVPSGVDEALADAAGRTAVRRMVDAAWAGGALPIVVVTPDPDGHVAATLEGSPAVLVGPETQSIVAAYREGADVARRTVHETTALLLWPGRMIWTDPETVTSLIEAHGRKADVVTRPRRAGQLGWPVLVPSARVDDVLAGDGGSVEEAVASIDTDSVELGDPGTVMGLEVALDELPDYAGPPEPVGGPPPEWGAAAADTPESGLGD